MSPTYRHPRALAPLAPASARRAQASHARVPAFAQREQHAAPPMAPVAPVEKKVRKKPGEFEPLPGGRFYEERMAKHKADKRARELAVQQARRGSRGKSVRVPAPAPQRVGGYVAPYPGQVVTQGGFGGFQQQWQQQWQALVPAEPLQHDWFQVSGAAQQMQGAVPAFPTQQTMAGSVGDLHGEGRYWDAAAVQIGIPPVAPAMGSCQMPWGSADPTAAGQAFLAAASAPGSYPGSTMHAAMPMQDVSGYYPDPAQDFTQAMFTPWIPPIDPALGLVDFGEVVDDLQVTPPGLQWGPDSQSESPPDQILPLPNSAWVPMAGLQPDLGDFVAPPVDEALEGPYADFADVGARYGFAQFFDFAPFEADEKAE
ncbi:hypothetical protein N0V95_004672 [Ascochyta clinopodiicola]|nr:hypothetical protein N0V95_004672 [Ascochyta clinopodiicola]